MIQWQQDDPLPPWGHGRPREGITFAEWVTFAVVILALGVLIGVSAFHFL
jgi:hypothetical protein